MTRLFPRAVLLTAVLSVLLIWGCAPVKKEAKSVPSVVVEVTPQIKKAETTTKKDVSPDAPSSKEVVKTKTKGGVFEFGKSEKKNSSTAMSAPPSSGNIEEGKDESGMKIGMQYFAPWRGHNFDTKNIVRMRGTVKKVKTSQQGGMMFVVTVLLNTKAKGDILVELGPLFYLRTKGLLLTQGNRLEVIGSLIRDAKGKERIISVEVSKGKRNLKFRDLSGTPLWANVQPRVWSPESQGLTGWSASQSTKPTTSNPDKAYVPNFDAPIKSDGKEGVVGPPSWDNIEQRQKSIRSRVGSGVPTSIGN